MVCVYVKKAAEIIFRCGAYFSILAAAFDGWDFSGVDWTELVRARLCGFCWLTGLVGKGEFVGSFVRAWSRCEESSWEWRSLSGKLDSMTVWLCLTAIWLFLSSMWRSNLHKIVLVILGCSY